MDNVGLSLFDYMDVFEEELDAQAADKVTLAGCAMFEIVTRRYVPGRTYDPAEEIEQHLAIARDGQVQFRAHTYHDGPGHYGIGRVQDAAIPGASVQEIGRLLDTWLYVRGDAPWTSDAGAGQWYLRVRSIEGKEQVQRGVLDGAFVDGMDLSWFIRERVPIAQLYLFDQDIL